jgi:hypothetical protein
MIAFDADGFLVVDLYVDPSGTGLIERSVEDFAHVDAIFAALWIFDAIGIKRRARCGAARLEPGSEMTRFLVVQTHQSGFGIEEVSRLFRTERQPARKDIVTLDQMDDPAFAWVVAKPCYGFGECGHAAGAHADDRQFFRHAIPFHEEGDNARVVFGATMNVKYLSCTAHPARSAVSLIETGTAGHKRLRRGRVVVYPLSAHGGHRVRVAGRLSSKLCYGDGLADLVSVHLSVKRDR